MDIGILLLLVTIVALPIIGFITGVRKRAFLQVGWMLTFTITSLSGCGYFWLNFDIPSTHSGIQHIIGLGVFVVAAILTYVTSVWTIVMKKNETGAEQTSAGDVAKSAAPEE